MYPRCRRTRVHRHRPPRWKDRWIKTLRHRWIKTDRRRTPRTTYSTAWVSPRAVGDDGASARTSRRTLASKAHQSGAGQFVGDLQAGDQGQVLASGGSRYRTPRPERRSRRAPGHPPNAGRRSSVTAIVNAHRKIQATRPERAVSAMAMARIS